MQAFLRVVTHVRRVWVVAVAMVLAMGAALHAAVPAVLDQAPANAQIVVVIPNMKGLSDKLAKLQEALQIPAPEMSNLLEEFKNTSGMVNGLKDDGAAMIVFTDIVKMMEGDGNEPPMAVAIEVTDYAAFVGNFEGNAADEVAHLSMDGSDGYARKVGDFAVFGPNEADVKAYAPAQGAGKIAAAVGKLGERYMSGGDALVYVDLQALGPVLKPKMKEGFDEMIAAMKEEIPADQAAMIEGMFAMYYEAIDAILTDGQGGVMALDLSDDGIGITKALQARPGSTLARYFPGGKRDSLLNAAPSKPYLMAMGIDTKAIDLVAIFERVLAKMPDDAGPLSKLYKDALPAMKLVNGAATVWYAPPEGQMMAGPGMLNMVNLYDTTDGPGYLAATKTYFDALNNVQIPMEEVGAEPMKFTTSYTAGAMNLEGVSVDQYSMKMAMPPELMQQMGPAAGAIAMMGGLGYEGLIGAKGNRVVMTTSMDAMTMSGALQSADKADGLGAQAGIAEARAKALPPDSAVEMYISVEGILQTVNPLVQMFAGQALPVPEGMPPISMGMSADNGGIAGRLYLPIKTLQGIVETAMTVQGAMGGGFDGDDGDGAEPPPF